MIKILFVLTMVCLTYGERPIWAPFNLEANNTSKCPTYTCVDAFDPVDNSTCAKNTSANSITWQLTACTNGTFCNIANANARSCIAPSAQTTPYLVPGETCSQNSQCFGNKCGSNKKCTAKEQGTGSCSYDYDCKVGMFCNSGNCKVLVHLDAACNMSTKCVNSASCVNSKCVGKATLSNGAITSDPMACKSLFALYDNEDNFKCHQPPILNNYKGEPVKCTPGSVCSYYFDPAAKGLNYTTTCKCGINPQGYAYCNPGIGSYSKYMSFVIYIYIYIYILCI